ncbi:hypothetical protein BROUX41_002495 [Berkeleyomyces rouxiae]|uniref:uncharacterized protein n=1 Tax=Berkeleyomyces rouxiae TaxID=2035830 RepID=UPI003B765DD5
MPPTSVPTRLPARARTQSLRKPAASRDPDGVPSRLPLKPSPRSTPASSRPPPPPSAPALAAPSPPAAAPPPRVHGPSPSLTSSPRGGLRLRPPSAPSTTNATPQDPPPLARATRAYPPSSSRPLAAAVSGPAPTAAPTHRRAKSVVTAVATLGSARPGASNAAPAQSAAAPPAAPSKIAGALHGATKPRAMSHHARTASLTTAPAGFGRAANPGAGGVAPLARKNTVSGAGSSRAQAAAASAALVLGSPCKTSAAGSAGRPPSPSKAPGPGSSGSSSVSLGAETSHRQNELLLLHIMHRDAAAVGSSWRESARAALGSRFRELAAHSTQLHAAEAARTAALNARALASWVGTDAGAAEAKILALDAILLGLWNMSETGGKYSRVVRRFERWADRVAEVQAARARGDAGALVLGDEVVMAGVLDAAWRAECMALGRRLDEWRRQLMELGMAGLQSGGYAADHGVGPASLHRILKGLAVLIRDMLTELAVMEQIENEAVLRERKWVDDMLAETETAHHRPAGAIWRGI